jgi:hypothetical protein
MRLELRVGGGGALRVGDASGSWNPQTGDPSAGGRSPAGWLCGPALGARRQGGAAFPAGERQRGVPSRRATWPRLALRSSRARGQNSPAARTAQW